MTYNPEDWKKYYLKNKKKINAQSKAWRQRNKERVKEYSREYRKTHKEQYQAYAKKYYPKRREYYKKRNQERRLKVLTFYSEGNPKCKCCNETMLEFLGIDHIDGGGTQHRKEIGARSMTDWLVRNNFPRGFQVLCHNCNMAKGFYGECPHQK